jgi:hypothetical protein
MLSIGNLRRDNGDRFSFFFNNDDTLDVQDYTKIFEKFYKFIEGSDLSWVDSEIWGLKKGNISAFRSEVLHLLRILKDSKTFDELAHNCIIIMSLHYKWYRHNEVPGIEFYKIMEMLNTNKENSRPLGARVLQNICGKDYVICPDT